jgi:carbon storage regulator
MLVLSRTIGETILVGDNIRLTVVGIRGDRVRLGIVAPADVLVDRAEVSEKRKTWPNGGDDSDPPQPLAVTGCAPGS